MKFLSADESFPLIGVRKLPWKISSTKATFHVSKPSPLGAGDRSSGVISREIRNNNRIVKDKENINRAINDITNYYFYNITYNIISSCLLFSWNLLLRSSLIKIQIYDINFAVYHNRKRYIDVVCYFFVIFFFFSINFN